MNENVRVVGAATPRAFRSDLRSQRLLSAGKAAWWTAQSTAGKAFTRPEPPSDLGETVRAPAPSRGRLRQAWREAFEKDAADVAAGLYPVTEAPPADLRRSLTLAADVFADAREVDARRRRGGGVEAREEAGSAAYPAYYRQNFHFQSGGWFTRESARRYEAQVEALFSGAAGPMRRRALSLLARAWKDRDQRGLRIVDVACGSGSFLVDLRATFPRASIVGLDLSPAYVEEAARRSGAPGIQAAAERLPFADASLDGLSCIYLFHELPPKVRRLAAAEFARVLKPGGVLAFADSVQAADVPDLQRLLQAFPAFFHEPFYESYQATDLPALFGDAGLALEGEDQAFLTRAMLLRRSIPPYGQA